jgi:hypothetical protein
MSKARGAGTVPRKVPHKIRRILALASMKLTPASFKAAPDGKPDAGPILMKNKPAWSEGARVHNQCL